MSSGMRGRSLGAIVGLGAALLALRPVGPLDSLLGLVLLPGRVVTPIGALSVPFAGALDAAVDGETAAREEALSLQLERAVLRSAWPESTKIEEGVTPVPGEVDARQGTKRDHIMVRVEDASLIHVGHPVVAGDVYVGRVVRIPFRDAPKDEPGLANRWMRRLGLLLAPSRPAVNVVEVALITGAKERVGAIVPADQDGESCKLVVGGICPRTDQVMLAMHNPESRATREGEVLVHETFGYIDGFDSLAEGFVIGHLRQETHTWASDPRPRTVLGVQPPVDFASGLNQVLVLTGAPDGRGTRAQVPTAGRAQAGSGAVSVLQAGRWLPVRLFGFGDAAPWRSTGRLNLGKRSGLLRGAAVVAGVRLVGRIARLEAAGSTVAFLGDRGFELDVLAQAVADPDGEPLVLGRIRSVGRVGAVQRFRWRPESSSRSAQWCARYAESEAGGEAAESVDVRLWTGSGLVGTPRGLLVGRTSLPADLPEDAGEIYLDLVETGSAGGELLVHVGSVTRMSRQSSRDVQEGPNGGLSK